MKLKMGYTPDTSYKDTLIPSGTRYYLTQVFFQSQFSVYGSDSVGTWVYFPIDGFRYNTTANLWWN
ncbi:MAG: hypothetical protein JST27_04560 [Bacteroidetes bacterium]|nr:hypothetical protein [Bacteroidota bacterium]